MGTKAAMNCYLAGCDAGCDPWSNGFCSPEHAAAWRNLPEDIQHPRGYAPLLHRHDLDYTLSLVIKDGTAIAKLANARTA